MPDITSAWSQAQEYLKEHLEATVFATWILPLKVTVKSPECIMLEAPDVFFRDWVKKNYSQAIEEAL